VSKGDIAKYTFMGRPIKPLALALSLSMATIFWFNIVANEGILVETLAGDVVGYAAGASSLLLFIGWWVKSQLMAEVGLLMSAGVWVSRAALILILGDWNTASFFFSASWVIAAVGAYLLEALDPDAKKGKV
jgi:hypothetical protein